MAELKTYFIGDSCFCVSLANEISEHNSMQILAAYSELRKTCQVQGIRDFVPSYTALAVHYDPLLTELQELIDEVSKVFKQTQNTNLENLDSREYTLPVIYNGEDLSRIGELHNLTESEIIEIHSGAEYTIAMIGFQPHFPYLIGLEQRLETPRLESPRARVPAGSVAIGGAQTGIYPKQSPGGWNLIGTSDPTLLTKLRPGDKIHFKEVDTL